MTIDPRIPMMTNTGGTIQGIWDNYNRIENQKRVDRKLDQDDVRIGLQSRQLGQTDRRLDMAQQAQDRSFQTQDIQDDLSKEALIRARFEQAPQREKARLTSTVLGSMELKGYVDRQDLEGARAYLENRKMNLQKRIANGEDIDTRETDMALMALEKDPQLLQKQLEQNIQIGELTGILTPANKGQGATIMAARQLMAEDKTLTFADAYSLAKSGAGQGNTVRDGQIMPMGGKQDTLQGDETSKAKGKELGKAWGENINSYEDFIAAAPGLNEFGNRLYQLADIATYTKTGELRDGFMRQFGFDPGDAARAKAEATTMIDTEILPLLKPTFGAAFTVKEGEWLRATMGDQNLSPPEKKAQIEARMASWQRHAERLARRIGVDAPSKDTFKIEQQGGDKFKGVSTEELLKQLGQ